MTCEEFYDKYMVEYIDRYIQESHIRADFNPRVCFAMLQVAASMRFNEFTIIDLETFDYDSFFYNIYRCTEKGLS